MKRQSQAKAMHTGQRNTILKQLLLRLLKSGIKGLTQWKNWSLASAEFPSKRMT